MKTHSPSASAPSPLLSLIPVISSPVRLRFGAIVLAAGASTRLNGVPKQLLPFRGQPLIIRSVEALLASYAWPVVVVLGAHFDVIRPVLSHLPIQIAENKNWPEGMASSIRAGLDILNRFSDSLDGALLAVCDQPHFSTSAVGRLADAWIGRNSIAAARYDRTAGVPALFGRDHFTAIQSLTGTEGARRILGQNVNCVVTVDLPELAADVDTPADYQSLLDSEGHA